MVAKRKKKQIRVKLHFPLLTKKDGQDVKIDFLTFNRLKAKHFRLMPDSFFENEGQNIKPQDIIPLIGALSGLDEGLVGEIDFEDLTSICEKIQDFLA